ncbi:MAG: polymorphic toxin-type HINT domain-containing protein, partial [Patescibacteria group bacterium]|nr:polymorphic toxin-type HINT domain-containing protein [Patescibacteria group bacterium]
GQRVLSENPELEGVVVEPLEIEPDHWRLVIFETVAPDGPVIESHVLCEQEFLELDRIAVGQTVDLSFSEFGFSGPSQVVRIAPCPPIEDGPGHVVTATFRVSASEIIDVYVDSLHEPIGTTPTHPFWSETRHAFVPAAELHAGEVLRSITGTIERVTAVVPRSTSEPVYNFEVEGEHVYYVSAAGILVHNQCISPNQWESIAGRALKKEGYSVLGSIKNASGHGVDLLLRNAAGDLVVAEVKSSARRWRGLSRLQKAKGAATYLGDAVNNAVGRQGLWTLQNLRGGSAALAAQIQAELKGASVTGILIQINEHAKRIRIRNW